MGSAWWFNSAWLRQSLVLVLRICLVRDVAANHQSNLIAAPLNPDTLLMLMMLTALLQQLAQQQHWLVNHLCLEGSDIHKANRGSLN